MSQDLQLSLSVLLAVRPQSTRPLRSLITKMPHLVPPSGFSGNHLFPQLDCKQLESKHTSSAVRTPSASAHMSTLCLARCCLVIFYYCRC